MKPNEDYCFNPYVIEDLDYEISPIELVQDVGVLVVEGRLPEFSSNGRCEGEHCWPVSLDSKKDCCLSDQYRNTSMCNFVQSVRGKLKSIWTEAIPAFIEVLVCLDSLFPSSCSKPEPCEIYLNYLPEISSQKILLLERWKLEVHEKETLSSLVNINMMLQAVRSFLHFSQLSAWLIQTGGRIPSRIFYRIIHGEPESWIEFNQQPEIHEFPKALTSKTNCIKVTTFSLPRIDLDTLISMSPYKETSIVKSLPFRSTRMKERLYHDVSGSSKLESLFSDSPDSEETPPKCVRKNNVVNPKRCDVVYVMKPHSITMQKDAKISTALRQKLSFESPKSSINVRKPFENSSKFPITGRQAKNMPRLFQSEKEAHDEQKNGNSKSDADLDHQNKSTTPKKTFYIENDENEDTPGCSAADKEHCNGFRSKHCNGFNKNIDSIQSEMSVSGYSNGFQGFYENGKPVDSKKGSLDRERNRLNKDRNLVCKGTTGSSIAGASSSSSLSEQISNVASSHANNEKSTFDKSEARDNGLTNDQLHKQEVTYINNSHEHSQSCKSLAMLESNARMPQAEKLRRSESCCSTRPRPISMAARLSLGACTVPVFHPKTGLPVASSPAPLRKPDIAKAIGTTDLEENENLLRSSIEIRKQRKASTGDYMSQAKILSRSAPASTRLLGNFEESVLKGRMPVYGTVEGFSAEIGASGTFCPAHITLPIKAHFFRTSDDDAPSPYLGHISLRNAKGKKGYHVPRKGTVQLTIFNPNKTVVKVFIVLYDFNDMPSNSHTFLRQKIVSVRKEPYEMEELQTLHYLVHLRFASTKHDRIYLHTDIRLIFPQQTPDVASSKLKVLTNGPCEPKYTPRDR